MVSLLVGVATILVLVGKFGRWMGSIEEHLERQDDALAAQDRTLAAQDAVLDDLRQQRPH
jgi:hypothetical protein